MLVPQRNGKKRGNELQGLLYARTILCTGVVLKGRDQRVNP
jgi:hypothetical protein